MRYYFQLHNRIGYAEDKEGSEHPSLAIAREKAIDDIRSILSEEARRGVIDLSGRIDVTDKDGNVLLTVSFGEAVTIRPA